jgi:hypothetical protein
MFSISYNELLDYIVNAHVKLADDILQYIHPDINKSRVGFVADVKRALVKYTDHKPLIISMYNDNISYEFYDNFDGYLKGLVPEKNIELIPLSIASIKLNPLNGTYVTSNNWDYDRNTHILTSGVGYVKYYASYPTRYRLAEDHRFTEDSKIYMLDDDDNYFKDMVAFEVLADIVNTRLSVTNVSQVQMLDFTTKLQQLEQELRLDNIYSESIYDTY